MAMVCAQEFPKVAIMFCFQIWLFPWSCQEWQCIYVSKSGSFQFPKVAIMFCFQIWLFPWSCQEWPKLAMYMFPWSCQEWQWCVQDLETDTLPLLAITEHTPLPFLATPECARFGNSYINNCHFWQSLTPLPFLATPRFGNRYCHCWQSLSTHAIIGHYKMSRIWTHLYIASFG